MAPNRIQNPTHLDAERNPPSRLRALTSKALSSLFPIDFSKTETRFILRLPTLVLMWRAVALCGLIILQLNDNLPEKPVKLFGWALNADMKDVCWMAYVATCGTLFISELWCDSGSLVSG